MLLEVTPHSEWGSEKDEMKTAIIIFNWMCMICSRIKEDTGEATWEEEFILIHGFPIVGRKVRGSSSVSRLATLHLWSEQGG